MNIRKVSVGLAVIVVTTVIAVVSILMFFPAMRWSIPQMEPESSQAEDIPNPLLAERYSDQARGISIRPPRGWQARTQGLLMWVNPQPDRGDTQSTQAQLEISAVPWTGTLEDFVSSVQGQLPAAGKQVIDDAAVTTTAGQPAHILGFIEGRTGVTYRIKQLMLIGRQKVWIIRGQSLAEVWEDKQYNSLFDAVLTSFELEE